MAGIDQEIAAALNEDLQGITSKTRDEVTRHGVFTHDECAGHI